MSPAWNLLYVPLVGFPLCLVLIMLGLFFCMTLIGLPIGIACLMLALRVVAL